MSRGEPSHHPVDVDGGGGPDFGGLLVELTGVLGQVRSRLDARLPRIPWEACHPVPLLGAVQLSAGAGTLNQSNAYGPNAPYWWDLRTLDLWGWTAGTVTVTLNSLNGAQVAVATTPGEFTWSSSHLLGPEDWLVFAAAGIAGNVQFSGQAIEVETGWLPEYLM